MDKLRVCRSSAVKLEERDTRKGGRKRGGRKEELGQNHETQLQFLGAVDSLWEFSVFQLNSVKLY